jgi:hypothetical protein
VISLFGVDDGGVGLLDLLLSEENVIVVVLDQQLSQLSPLAIADDLDFTRDVRSSLSCYCVSSF